MLKIEGNIVNKNKVFRGRIEIDERGMIKKIGEPKGDADFIFKDELIFPGFVDLHVHAREDVSHTRTTKKISKLQARLRYLAEWWPLQKCQTILCLL